VQVRRISVVAALTLYVACGGDSTGPIDTNYGTSGGITFTYTGAGSGIFNAKGTVSAPAAAPYATTWAIGWKDPADNSTNVVANLSRAGGISDIAVIVIKGQTTGTVTIDPNCVISDTATCNDVLFASGQNSNGTTFAYICSLTSGVITVSSISSTNVAGSFSGSGSCFTANGTSSSFVVTNGSFNVPLLASPPGNIV
jgi:hypothetical protein